MLLVPICASEKLNHFFFISAQGKVSELVSSLFNIQHDYVGSLISNMARVCINLIQGTGSLLDGCDSCNITTTFVVFYCFEYTV